MTKPGTRLRALSPIIALALFTAAFLGLTGAPASAATSTIICLGSSSITYNPGLLLTPRSVHYDETDTYSTCTSTDPTLTSGSATADATLNGSCLHAPAVFEDPSYVVHWNNGQSSTFALTYTDTIVAGTENVTGVGTVTAGALAGATATFVWLYPVLNPLQCLANPGVTSQSGVLTATIILP